ncbi:MAG: hypothetical protein J0I14_04330 [Propionibacteriaceae bacterium]|jgi:hypothetical protein|nr:hypothetical protein [Propionibacteriaceae bacterium]
MPARRVGSDEFDGAPDVYTRQLGVHVVASPIPWGRVATYLSKAEVDAIDQGLGDLPVVVRPGQASAPEAAFAIMRLADFARLAKDAVRGREVLQQLQDGLTAPGEG